MLQFPLIFMMKYLLKENISMFSNNCKNFSNNFNGVEVLFLKFLFQCTFFKSIQEVWQTKFCHTIYFMLLQGQRVPCLESSALSPWRVERCQILHSILYICIWKGFQLENLSFQVSNVINLYLSSKQAILKRKLIHVTVIMLWLCLCFHSNSDKKTARK